MQIVLQKRETTDGTLATGLLLGLWIGEVLATAEYWLLRTASFALRALRWSLRPSVIAFSMVLGVYGGLAAGMHARIHDARIRSAYLDVKAISKAAQLYQIETGQWPPTLEKLVPRFLGRLLVDPWGRNYALYRGNGGIAIVSAGPDGELGSADDLIDVSPER